MAQSIVQIANIPQLTMTVPAVKAVIMLLMALPWLRLATWVNEDALLARADRKKWNAITVAGGAVGLLLWLVMPYYVVGLLFYLVLAAGGLLAYVAYRNDRVPTEKRVLTREHLAELFAGKKGGKKGARKALDLELLTKVTIYDNYEKIVFPPDLGTAEEKDISTYNHVQEFLYDVAWRRASEVALTPAGQNSRVLYVIDGVAHEQPAIPPAQAEEMIQFIKEISGMEVDEVRRPQKGRLSIDAQSINTRADMELSAAGTTGGQQLIFRIIQEVVRTNLGELGMPDDILGQISSIAQTKNGLFICAGRRGSGVTSTLYSMLRQRDVFITNINTLESKPPIDLENVTQNTYGENANLAKTLSVAIQRGLDVLMIDQVPDAETAKMLADLAAKKPVLVGMQASDTFSALARWVQLVGDATAAVQILRGVVCQMLIRQLCPKCKVAYKPDTSKLAKMNLASGAIDNFYRPPSETDDGAAAGTPGKEIDICPECQGSGYKGRIAVFELLKLTAETRHLIIDGATVAQIRAAARKNKMLYLQEMAMQRVMDGTTSVQEVIRVMQQQQQQQAAKK
jgi:type II secretory ATPase GspE/PulE/Tfp pilus assembly ATPase PilB-like protein